MSDADASSLTIKDAAERPKNFAISEDLHTLIATGLRHSETLVLPAYLTIVVRELLHRIHSNNNIVTSN